MPEIEIKNWPGYPHDEVHLFDHDNPTAYRLKEGDKIYIQVAYKDSLGRNCTCGHTTNGDDQKAAREAIAMMEEELS